MFRRGSDCPSSRASAAALLASAGALVAGTWAASPSSAPQREEDDFRRLAGSVQELGPRLHQLAPLRQRVASSVGSLDRVAGKVGQGGLGDLPREVRLLAGPIPEGRAEPVDRVGILPEA